VQQEQVNQAVRLLGLNPEEVAQVRITPGGVRAEVWDGNPDLVTTWIFLEIETTEKES